MKQVRLYQNTTFNIGKKLALDEYAKHHLIKVLRFPKGQEVILFNGDGYDYLARVVEVKKQCIVEVLTHEKNLSESKLDLTLAQGIAKGEKMDFLIQKAVELGVNRIIPIVSERVVVRLKADKVKRRQAHWQQIAIHAAEQSGRSVVPKVEAPTKLDTLLDHQTSCGFVLHHRAEKTLKQIEACQSAIVLIGPEGGFSDNEINQATEANYLPLLLGKRVLRTETASLAAIANMQLLWGS